MQTSKQSVHSLIDTLPQTLLSEVENFILFVKKREEDRIISDLQWASLSSMDFWDNDTDDEVWNDETLAALADMEQSKGKGIIGKDVKSALADLKAEDGEDE